MDVKNVDILLAQHSKSQQRAYFTADNGNPFTDFLSKNTALSVNNKLRNQTPVWQEDSNRLNYHFNDYSNNQKKISEKNNNVNLHHQTALEDKNNKLTCSIGKKLHNNDHKITDNCGISQNDSSGKLLDKAPIADDSSSPTDETKIETQNAADNRSNSITETINDTALINSTLIINNINENTLITDANSDLVIVETTSDGITYLSSNTFKESAQKDLSYSSILPETSFSIVDILADNSATFADKMNNSIGSVAVNLLAESTTGVILENGAADIDTETEILNNTLETKKDHNNGVMEVSLGHYLNGARKAQNKYLENTNTQNHGLQRVTPTTPSPEEISAKSTPLLNDTEFTTSVLQFNFNDTKNLNYFPTWYPALGHGQIAPRSEFEINLRSHTQNLPIHEQVALSIRHSVRDGGGSITLQLSPSDLGRIRLNLNIDEEKNVQTKVVVERAGTLEILLRDVKALERTLLDAGLKVNPGDLSLSLQRGDSESFAHEFESNRQNISQDTKPLTSDELDETLTNKSSAVVNTADGWIDVKI